MSNSELLACPFCGCEASMHEDDEGRYWAQCDMCQARGDSAQFVDNAEQWWNMRATRTQLDELRAALVEARKWLCPPGPPINPSHPIGQTILMIDKALGVTSHE